jgi:ribonuclease P protein component
MHAARLRRGEDIARVLAEGIARNDKLFSLRALSNDEAAVRVAVSASRAVGGAVKRNRARRRVHEAVRTVLGDRGAAVGMDLVLLVRPPALHAPAIDVRGAVERELGRVLR